MERDVLQALIDVVQNREQCGQRTEFHHISSHILLDQPASERTTEQRKDTKR